MRMFPASILAALSALAIMASGGCGDDDETTTSATAESTGSTASTVHDPGEGAEGGPTGELSANGIGPVTIGASEEEVTTAFGEPILKEDVDFSASKEAPQENWIYRFSDGDVTIKFDTKKGEFAAYDVYTTELETADGITVGDPDSLLEKRYGNDLTGSPLGIHALVLSATEPGTAESPALTFAIDGKTISAISGGQVVQPAGE